MKRKIIQLTTAAGDTNSVGAALALCNDGTVWIIELSGFDRPKAWRKMDDIPQYNEGKS